MRLVLLILLGILILVPWIFEQITFQYYLHGTSLTFFAYSGTRMPLFIMLEVGIGAAFGFFMRQHNFALYCLLGILAILVFAILVYQLCDSRACYYAGPDKIGELRFFAMLASGFVTGTVIGNIRYHINPKRESGTGDVRKLSYLFPFCFALPLFVGSYASALLYNVPSAPPFTIFLFLSFLTVSFLPTGLTLSLFADVDRKSTIALSIAALLSIFIVFRNWSALTEANDLQSTTIQLALSIIGATLATAVGHAIGVRLRSRKPSAILRKSILSTKEISLLLLSLVIFTAFGLFDSHPRMYAPVDMLPRKIPINYSHLNYLSGAPDPMHYSGVFDTESYFPTKRVEVTLGLDALSDKTSIDKNMLLVGMGAQSPNCCKDGLDYGYRADIAITSGGLHYLVARAWETCDQNAACSGLPWESTMHEAEVPLSVEGLAKISLAMSWTGSNDKIVHWYYCPNGSQDWIEYSSFTAPRIENPYFNLGVAYVGNFAANFPSGNANFFQVGAAGQQNNASSQNGKMAFQCPAYYKDATKHCFPSMQTIDDGDSHWKVLWQWGLPAIPQK